MAIASCARQYILRTVGYPCACCVAHVGRFSPSFAARHSLGWEKLKVRNPLILSTPSGEGAPASPGQPRRVSVGCAARDVWARGGANRGEAEGSGRGRGSLFRRGRARSMALSARGAHGATLLHVAVRQPERLRRLVSAELPGFFRHPPYCSGEDGSPSIVHCAALAGVVESVQVLLEAGCELDCVDAKGRTPLIRACSEGLDEMARFLISRGADVCVMDGEGQNCAHAAFAVGHIELGDWLVSCGGADPTAVDADGRTPLEWRKLSAEEQELEARSQDGAEEGEVRRAAGESPRGDDGSDDSDDYDDDEDNDAHNRCRRDQNDLGESDGTRRTDESGARRGLSLPLKECKARDSDDEDRERKESESQSMPRALRPARGLGTPRGKDGGPGVAFVVNGETRMFAAGGGLRATRWLRKSDLGAVIQPCDL